MTNSNITTEHISFVENTANKVSKTATESNLKKKWQKWEVPTKTIKTKTSKTV